MTPTLALHLPFLPSPYVRVGRERWTDRAKAYEASQREVRERLVDAARVQGWPAPWPGQYSVALTVAMTPTAASLKRKRGAAHPTPMPPKTGGDWDNFLKAILDAAVDRTTKRGEHLQGVVSGDGPDRFVGPAQIGGGLLAEMPFGIVLSESEWVRVVFVQEPGFVYVPASLTPA